MQLPGAASNTMPLFKPSIKAKIMGANLTLLAEIKDLALKSERLEREKKSRPKCTNFKINPRGGFN
jgi:hypothetical protein